MCKCTQFVLFRYPFYLDQTAMQCTAISKHYSHILTMKFLEEVGNSNRFYLVDKPDLREGWGSPCIPIYPIYYCTEEKLTKMREKIQQKGDKTPLANILVIFESFGINY